MIKVSFENQDMTVEPLQAQQILAGLIEGGARLFRIEPEDIALLKRGEVVTLSGNVQQMGALGQFCQAALNGLLQNDWRDPDTSLEAHQCSVREQEELAHELC